MKFSACWIVKNEAHHIKLSIDSVKDCVEEIIVVDTGSTDDTIQIAAACGAQIHHFPWINDFAAAKNYALSLLQGDYVIFPDADEYFLPPLTQEDGGYLEQLFEDTHADLLILNRIEIDKDSNSYLAVTPCERILRRAAIHYENKTHDIPKIAGGKLPKSAIYPYTRLMHTGYSYALLTEKGIRNIKNLEAEQTQTTDPLKRYINACYLLREHVGMGNDADACQYTHYLLEHDQYKKDACGMYDDGFVFIFYCAILMAVRYPHEFSREELRVTLFDGIKENYPASRDALLADLYYQLKFDFQEDRFLRELAQIQPLLSQAMPAAEEVSLQIETEILKQGAQTALRQGDKTAAKRYALDALSYAQQPDDTLQQILDNCNITFSACWIVKNEGDKLKLSLESLKDCAEELIVVDTGSTDDTALIAEACGAKVSSFPWEDDFSAAKNYALSLANGDYVIFLDGDEYFLPPLTKEEGGYFQSLFERTGADVLILSRIEVNPDTNTFMAITPVERILRRATIHFENKIHENPFLKNGELAKSEVIETARLMHTGYANSNYIQKAKRNIKILESEQNHLQNPVKLYLNAAYLMRENLVLSQEEQACEYLSYLLQHHPHLKAACHIHYTGMLPHLYRAILLAERNSTKFQKKEIYEKLFGGIKENYPDTRDAALGDAYYQLKFHYREASFLAELPLLESRIAAMPPSDCSEARQAESEIFQRGAEAAFLRRDFSKAAAYAIHAIESMQQLDITPQKLLIYCQKENPSPQTARLIEEYFQSGRFLDLTTFPVLPHSGAVGARSAEATEFLLQAAKLDGHMDYPGITAHPQADAAAAADSNCAFYLARACLMLGQYERAYDTILPYVTQKRWDINLLEFLLIIGEKAEKELGQKARNLYEAAAALWDSGQTESLP